MEELKKCSRCGEEKPLSAFNARNGTPCGKQSFCKECNKKYTSQWEKEHRDESNARHRKWRSKNVEYNRDRVKQWAIENPEKQKERSLRWRKNNKEYDKERAQKWRDENREKVREQGRKWYSKNKESRRIYNRSRKAQKKRPGSYTLIDIKILLAAQKNKCLACKKNFTADDNYTVDHIVPLSKGGGNDITNIQLLHLKCNCKKKTKTIDYRTKKVIQEIFKQQELFE